MASVKPTYQPNIGEFFLFQINIIFAHICRLDKSAHDALEKAGGFIKDISKGNMITYLHYHYSLTRSLSGGDAKGSRDLPRKVVSAANQVMPVLEAVSELNSVAKVFL